MTITHSACKFAIVVRPKLYALFSEKTNEICFNKKYYVMVTKQNLPFILDLPSRFPEKLTGKMMPTEITHTTTSRPIMWR